MNSEASTLNPAYGRASARVPCAPAAQANRHRGSRRPSIAASSGMPAPGRPEEDAGCPTPDRATTTPSCSIFPAESTRARSGGPAPPPAGGAGGQPPAAPVSHLGTCPRAVGEALGRGESLPEAQIRWIMPTMTHPSPEQNSDAH